MKPVFHADVPAELSAVRPLGDFVLVKRLPDEQPTGIILAHKIQDPDRPGPKIGLVIECGPGDRLKNGKRAPMHCAPGDTVVYQRAPANTVSINGDEYQFLHEQQHVLLVLEGEAA